MSCSGSLVSYILHEEKSQVTRSLFSVVKLLEYSPPTANSSSEIQVLSTEHGIILYSTVTYYHEDLRVGWLHKCVESATHTFFHCYKHLTNTADT